MSPTMTPAPSKPGHTILCTIWHEYPRAAVGKETWLAGCTCGMWSHRGKGEEVNKQWAYHLEEAD